MRAIPYKGYLIRPALPTGGKAGKGNNKTSTIQVFKAGDNSLLKMIRWNVQEAGDITIALHKAIIWIEEDRLGDKKTAEYLRIKWGIKNTKKESS